MVSATVMSAAKELASRARRISDTVADLGAKTTALATLLPTTVSGVDAPHGPGSRTIGGFTTGVGPRGSGSHGGGAGRPAARDRLEDLITGVVTKGAASRQRLKAIVRHADAAFEAGRRERALLRTELEQWRARDAAVAAAVEDLAGTMTDDWQTFAGTDLEESLLEPLKAVLHANEQARAQQSAYNEIRSGAYGTEGKLWAICSSCIPLR